MDGLSFWNASFISFSLALQSSAQSFGRILNDVMIPPMYEAKNSITFGLWLGFGFAILCLICCIIFVLLDWYGSDERQQRVKRFKPLVILKFQVQYWLVSIYGGFAYMATNSFATIISGMAQSRFGFDIEMGGIFLVF